MCRVGLIFLSEFFNALGLISRLPGTLPDCSISRLVGLYFDSDGIKFDSLDTCDGYFEYKLDGAHKICVQSFSFDRVHRIWVQPFKFWSSTPAFYIIESVQPFARLLLIEYA